MTRIRFPWTSMLVLGAIGAIFLLLSVVFERIGVGASGIGFAAVASLGAFMVAAAALGATKRPSLFFLAGRQVGPLAGAAPLLFVALLSTASWQGGFVPSSLLNPGGFMLLPAVAALLVGALALAPMLRRSGAFTIVDFIRFRFRAPIPTAVTLIAGAMAAALLAVCGAKLAIDTLMSVLTVERTAALAIAIVPAAIVAIGGWRSISLALVAGVVCLVLAVAAPLVVTGARFGGLAEMLLPASTVSRAVEARLTLWGAGQDLARAASLPVQMGAFARSDDVTKALGLALSCLALLSVTGLLSVGRAAVRSSLCASVLLLAVPVVSTLIAGGAVLALDATLVGRQADTLPPAARQGLLDDGVTLCGAAPSVQRLAAICAGRAGPPEASPAHALKSTDIAVKPAALGSGAAAALGLPAIFVGLYRLMPFLVGLAGLTVGAFSLAAMLGHSLFYRLIQPRAVTSSRLAAARLMAIGALALAAEAAKNDLVAIDLAFAAAGALAAATILPMLALALLPRASGVTASLAALGGLVVAGILLYAQQNPAAAAVYGFIGALFMGCAGLASAPPTAEERAVAAALGSRSDDALILDRGA
ncbi:MAG: hypothetical protein K2P80_05405 [Beijerinckiaceae bacterium]|nr:hypothetical protein [Beijerinckiaceae bacterium]